MFIGVGVGAYWAAVFHLVTHAVFKACLFLGSGSVIHGMHGVEHDPAAAQDMRNMGGLARHLPWTATLMWVATLAIAGIPPFAGFFSKDEILGAAFAEATARPIWYAFWAMGIAAALLTAFYMTRLMLYTFHGPNRTGEREREHLHEAPWLMTGPLLVLGALTVVGGGLNIPRLFGGGALLEHWLEPVTRSADRLRPALETAAGTEWALVAGAVLVAGLGMVAAFRLLKPEALVPARLAAPETGLGRLLWKKWYVDELYDAIIVRPVMWFSREVLWKIVDARLVDGWLVNGTATVSRAVGWVGSRLQTGEVGAYVVVFVIGVLAVLVAAVR
jgi:NADH-quinone oxidoreductase subunit L